MKTGVGRRMTKVIGRRLIYQQMYKLEFGIWNLEFDFYTV